MGKLGMYRPWDFIRYELFEDASNIDPWCGEFDGDCHDPMKEGLEDLGI